MTQFVTVVHYGWRRVDNQYTDGQAKAMVVSTKVTHQDLIQGIYKRIRVSPSEFIISVHYQCISNLGM